MPRALLALLLLPLLVTAAPVPKSLKAAELYFPTTEGAKMVMLVQVGSGEVEYTETVTKVSVEDGVYTVSVGRSEGQGYGYTVSEAGLWQLPYDGDVQSKPIPILKAGVRKGQSWGFVQEGPGQKLATPSTYTYGGVEEVEVPAGKFTALRVDSEGTAGVVTRNQSSWYAPGIGRVKSEIREGKEKQVIVLKEFTPGKSAKK
jgi:hypothetical protein